MKIALLEVSHWHFPLYVETLLASEVEIVALSDRDADVRERYAATFGCRAHDDVFRLIAEEAVDFAFAFGRHVEMPDIGQALVAAGIPFSIEKPGGLDADAVAGLRRAAEARDLFAAVALIERVGPVRALLTRLIEDEGADFTNSCWRFIAGPPERYPSIGCAWMLDPAVSGGGSLINLSHHYIDMAHFLLGGTAVTVMARTSNRLHGSPVEDYAMLSLSAAGGKTALVETGYAFPDNPALREYSFSVISKSHYVRSRLEGLSIYRAGQDAAKDVDLDLNSNPLFGRYAARVLDDVRTGKPPVAGLADLEATMRVIDAGYAAAKSGATVTTAV
ncbi:MAG: Gfo/Idh/MocA family oxidoreductase [Alphaproteobacteria bacterium]|nr:Gfo/Idh/MocA family oxidoreductase [Alphaproteobacteria bacterium]